MFWVRGGRRLGWGGEETEQTAMIPLLLEHGVLEAFLAPLLLLLRKVHLREEETEPWACRESESHARSFLLTVGTCSTQSVGTHPLVPFSRLALMSVIKAQLSGRKREIKDNL